MTSSEILDQIHDFPYWHYPFDLRGYRPPVSESLVNRHFQRKAHFFDPLVKHLGGSLAGKRVLDLGCNAAFWSLCALDAGCDFVVGIDAQAVNLAQARFVFDAKGVARDRYLFKRANVFDVDFRDFGEFDIVLCLGLLYHVNRPITLLEKMAQVNRDILLIDTQLSTLPGRTFEIRYESRTGSTTRLSPYDELVLYPTRLGLMVIAQHLGYQAVILKPKFSNYLGAEDYKTGRRRAFVCAKQTDLASLPAETEAINRVVEIARLNRDYARQAFGYLSRWMITRIGKPASRV